MQRFFGRPSSACIRGCWIFAVGTLLCTAPAAQSQHTAFSAVDDDLNAVYRSIAQQRPHVFEELQIRQRRWLEYRDRYAEQAAELYDRGTPIQDSAVYWQARTDLTIDRVSYLRAIMTADRFVDWDGVWIDSYGGVLELTQDPERPDRVCFSLSVVRGVTYHTGEISGCARSNGPTMWFSDGYLATDDDEYRRQAWLTFVLRHPYLVITGANTGWYHGARAYFDGEYVRRAPLP